MKFVAPGAKAVTNCAVEVESAQGDKVRLELKAVATTELASLIHAFRELLSDAADCSADAHLSRD